MGLDTTNNMSLWKDKVALEMNVATLNSFTKAGVTIVDQHTASEHYMIHMTNELKDRGGCPSDWVWLNPNQSGSLTPVYHQEMLHYHLTPSFDRPMESIWRTYRYSFYSNICPPQLKALFAHFIYIRGYKKKPKMPD